MCVSDTTDNVNPVLIDFLEHVGGIGRQIDQLIYFSRKHLSVALLVFTNLPSDGVNILSSSKIVRTGSGGGYRG